MACVFDRRWIFRMATLCRFVRQVRVQKYIQASIWVQQRSVYSMVGNFMRKERSACNVCTCNHGNIYQTALSTMPPQLVKYYSTTPPKDGLWTRVKKSLGLTGKLKFKRRMLRRSGLRLYMCCIELVDHRQFFEQFPLADTFDSWFRITELHIWMVIARLSAEGEEGKVVRDMMMIKMWEDVEKRAKNIGENVGASARREAMQIFSQQLMGAIYAYDEGLLSTDKDLAGAVWRVFFQMECDDPEHLELLVKYIRKQVLHLDQQESGIILGSGLMTWLPLHGEEDKERTRLLLKRIITL